ncbi:hypothetical protein [Archangium violaceum]|uniref:hypothetical protein n=1 Tax=Archangium violaceum TaxID=83451 RepID=UPI000695ADD3|nr:hypothetical protein [Archangium violaceum]
MKSVVSLVVSLAASLLLACGAGASADESSTTSSPAGDEQGAVTAAAPICGDGICALIERSNCPADCPNGICGDGVCCNGETTLSCPSDCPRDVPYCYKNVMGSTPDTEASGTEAPSDSGSAR